MSAKKWGGVLIAVLLVGAVAIQFVPVDRTNPPVTGEIDAPEAVLDVFVASCYDCHSHETRWTWPSRVAPVSWVIAHHVEEGREYLNFSTWEAMDAEMRAHLKHEIIEEVEEGKMPLKAYVLVHPEAAVSPDELERLRAWAQGAGSQAGPESHSERGENDDEGEHEHAG
jgi:hypothetical protein